MEAEQKAASESEDGYGLQQCDGFLMTKQSKTN
jgi:hypothetical protein